MTFANHRTDRLDIVRPTLLVDRDRAIRNIERMASRAAAAGVIFRPHFKTHQSRDVGRWFRDLGVDRITVSSLDMAHYFADDGWSDITIAFPVNLRELPVIAELAGRVRLGILLDSPDAVEGVARTVDSRVDAWVKIDTGYGRAGIAWDDEGSLAAILAALRKHGVDLSGVLTHNGLTYRESTAEGVRRVHSESVGRILAARAVLLSEGAGECLVSVGDTPSSSIEATLDGVDEMRPGNFVFYDLMQVSIGSCSMDDIAVAVACPVVGVYSERGRALLYGGAVHLSLASRKDQNGRDTFGAAGIGWPSALAAEWPVVSLSQEHGLLEIEPGRGDAPVQGDLVSVLPVHSCLTCSMYSDYLTTDGKRLHTLRSC